MNSTELNPQVPTGMSTRGMRVLIAEDEALVANVIEYELEVLGAEIVGKATDGRQAVTLTQRLRPDLVLMDVEMPEVDGLAAAGEIQERCPTPLVMLTVYSEPQTIIRAVAAGAGAYLLKPPRAGELQRAMLVAWGRFAALTELRRLNAELQNAHRQLGRLRGLLPICMYCHKIRTEHQSWEAIEQYISKRTEATFTHSICPACARKNFPEIQF